MASDLTVIMKTKDLCSYIMAVTQKSPKYFRFSFVNRLHNLAFDINEYFKRTVMYNKPTILTEQSH